MTWQRSTAASHVDGIATNAERWQIRRGSALVSMAELFQGFDLAIATVLQRNRLDGVKINTRSRQSCGLDAELAKTELAQRFRACRQAISDAGKIATLHRVDFSVTECQ